jgi:hypothetical protein
MTDRSAEYRVPAAGDDAEGDSLAPLVGQMLFMPLSMMMYGLNLLARTARGVPDNPIAPERRARPGPTLRALGPRDPGAEGRSSPGRWSSLQPEWRRPEFEIIRGGDRSHHARPSHDRKPEHHAPEGREEQKPMSENKSLQDDMLKTVRYWVAFEKRDFETVLHQGIDQVYDNLTDAQFTAWKMAEFMQKLDAGDIELPIVWKDKKRPFFTLHTRGNRYLGDIAAEDKKYLTVDWEVVGRVQRRKGRFEERKTEALEEIAEKL